LNPDKIQFKRDKFPFIGHVASKDGLCADPAKMKAILEMPKPQDVAGIQCLLGFAQYSCPGYQMLPSLCEI